MYARIKDSKAFRDNVITIGDVDDESRDQFFINEELRKALGIEDNAESLHVAGIPDRGQPHQICSVTNHDLEPENDSEGDDSERTDDSELDASDNNGSHRAVPTTVESKPR